MLSSVNGAVAYALQPNDMSRKNNTEKFFFSLIKKSFSMMSGNNMITVLVNLSRVNSASPPS